MLRFTDIAYSDASFVNLPEGKSQGGCIVFLVEENRNAVPVSWRSRKVKRVVKTTLNAETLALDESAIQSFCLKQVLAEIINLFAEELSIIISTDNQSLFESPYSAKIVDDKCLLLDISSLREKLENNDISKISWVDKHQIADCLTKCGAPTQLTQYAGMLHQHTIDEHEDIVDGDF